MITGIRHRCLVCHIHDVCTSCLGSNVANLQRCLSDATSPGPHRYAPMFDEYCNHREAAPWTADDGLMDNSTFLYHPIVDPDRCPIIPRRERWHKDLTDARGWESEPDEGRRIKTRFAHYHARKPAVNPGVERSRVRSQSLRPASSSTMSSPLWRDHVVELLDDEMLCCGLQYIGLGRH